MVGFLFKLKGCLGSRFELREFGFVDDSGKSASAECGVLVGGYLIFGELMSCPVAGREFIV